MQPGWNLGNSLDAVGADETAWGNPPVSQELLDNVRAQGFNSIRIRTPFKEFDVAFQPDDEAGTITLTPEFFAEVDDGSTVNLTFHFWSGETVAYTLTRSGDTVTGAAD